MWHMTPNAPGRRNVRFAHGGGRRGGSGRVPRRMRFFEYEAREVVKQAGIPVTDYGFTTDPAEARQIAERIGSPVVIKSQVLTGGGIKGGGAEVPPTPPGGRPNPARTP